MMTKSDERPNILLITTDQQRFDTIHAAGNPHIRTPHLNWLSDRGIRFSRCYSDAPLCIPARATIMTGRTGYRNELTDNSEDVRPIDGATSLPGLLTRAGYQTRAQGKMHFVPRRKNYGFEHMELLEDYYRTMANHPEYGVPADHGLGQCEREPAIATVRESHSLTHWTVDRSVDFLETRDESRPFFLWTSFSKPHPPFDPCLNYWLLYQNADVPQPVFGDWSAGADIVPAGFQAASYYVSGCHRFSEQTLLDVRRAYYALITQIDYNLGRLFARMRELGVLDNTLILFTSDHGEMLGDHHICAKSIFLEGASHVPLLLRPPEKRPGSEERGRVCDQLVSLADTYATCLGAAGVAMPDGYEIDGMDLRRIARGQLRRDTLVGVCGGLWPQFAIIRVAHKYTYCVHGASELLFDLSDDPYEQLDLSRDPTFRALKEELREALVAEIAAVRPAYLDEGQLPVRDAPQLDRLRGGWPGFHSRERPDDVMH
jgi:arylsulfatase A-like enzyme